MSKRTFKDLFRDAEKSDAYRTELAILRFTEDMVRAMGDKGVTRAELARRIGTSPAYVTKILRGSTNFTLATIVRIAHALNMRVDVRLEPRAEIEAKPVHFEARNLFIERRSEPPIPDYQWARQAYEQAFRITSEKPPREALQFHWKRARPGAQQFAPVALAATLHSVQWRASIRHAGQTTNTMEATGEHITASA